MFGPIHLVVPASSVRYSVLTPMLPMLDFGSPGACVLILTKSVLVMTVVTGATGLTPI